jgi:hypothetical protein
MRAYTRAIGISCGAALAFGTDVGVAGLWWGLAVGLTVTAGLGLALLLRTDWEQEVQLAQLRVHAGEGTAGAKDGSVKPTVQPANDNRPAPLPDCSTSLPIYVHPVSVPPGVSPWH